MDVDQMLSRSGLPEVAVATDEALDRTVRRGRTRRRRRAAVGGALALVVAIGAAAVLAAGLGGDDAEQVATGRQEQAPSTAAPVTLPAEPEPGDAASWDVVPDEPPSAEAATFTARVMRIGCNGGVTGRVLRPGIVATDTEVVVTFNVEASPGVHTCPGNDEVLYEVDLGQPLGDRSLVDGESGEVRWTGVLPSDCEAEDGSDTDVATEPDWRRWADYLPWTDAEGCLVRIDVVAERPGPEHCGWEAASVLITGPAVGERYTTPADSRSYVRDPDGVFGDEALTAGFDADARVPDTAVDSGYRQGDRELWHDPAEPSAVWLVSPSGTERWPEGETPLCQ